YGRYLRSAARFFLYRVRPPRDLHSFPTRRSSDLGIAAWISALIAALPGLGDYLTMALRSDAAAMATTHMLLNVTVVGMYFVAMRSEEHTSELQSPYDLVCRLLLEKKK